jgi:hypothetical protein
MPGDGLAHGPPATKKAGGSYHRFSQIIRHSLRDGFNAYIGLSPGTGLSCSHHARDHHLARLTPASGCQDHTTSRPPQRRSSARMIARVAKASIASRLTFGDDWPQRPSCRGGTRHYTSDLQNTQRQIFLRRGLDSISEKLPVGQITGTRRCLLRPRDQAEDQNPWLTPIFAARPREAVVNP